MACATPYAVLERTSGREVPVRNPRAVTLAFREASRRYHPDRCEHPQAGELMQRINAAREHLVEGKIASEWERKPLSPQRRRERERWERGGRCRGQRPG